MTSSFCTGVMAPTGELETPTVYLQAANFYSNIGTKEVGVIAQ